MIPLDKPNGQSCLQNAFVILLVPFLFLLALLLGYFGIFSLKVELHTLIIVGFIFVVFAFFVKYNANYAICHMKSTFHLMEESLHIALRENALTIMGKTKSTLHVEAFVYDYYQDIGNENFARVASSVFPMLGILGTFIVIAISMPDFTIANTEALDREISLLLSGIGTAFYASIYGIMLSLIWTYFEKRGMAKGDKQMRDLKKVYDARIWKESELIKHQHLESQTKDQPVVEMLKETFNMNFLKEMQAANLESFSAMMQENTQHFNLFAENMKEISLDLRETLKSLHTKKEGLDAVSLMQQNIEGFNQNAQNLEKAMGRFDNSVDHAFDKMDTELAESIKKLATFTDRVSMLNQNILDNIQHKSSEKN